MHTLKRLVFFVCLAFISLVLNGQNKYALLIGINDYYEEPGIKSPESLNGSVNDANAIGDLLIKKFGFKKKDIDTIYNAAATRDNIVDGLKRKLKQCKKGDIMVFYFSGHGVWMRNSQLRDDVVKKGMNQAMLTSDLYNYRDYFKCFLRDFTLKRWFNYFIDKEVVLTSIFDCCFSGNLARDNPDAPTDSARTKSVNFDKLMSRLTGDTKNTKAVMDSIAGITITEPIGCAVDAAGKITDTLDSDMDGVPDCKDKEKWTDVDCMPVNADGIGKCRLDYLLQKTLNNLDGIELQNNNTADTAMVTSTRSFNVNREVIRISERDTIARPADREKSRFLFMSATTDAQKAMEFNNENNIMHGLFTASILRVFNKYPANTPVAELFRQIKLDMKRIRTDQTPTQYGDPTRYNNNLIGAK